MELFITPTISNLRQEYGYEEWEDENDDALLVQKGYDGYTIEVEDGESFEIPEGHEGQIIDDDTTYYERVEIFEDVFDKEEIMDNLYEGHYRLEGDVIISEDSL
ncbi:MAG: hypothetical protein HUK04_00495 [Bacteroidaceae bacterium]|nr:hypothetical protein [Bacteroidaceae bacterium]